ncbi:hypothetical protein HYDPIDRAFT_97377 [Hydnomerulius pinastri MD-312]|uniref:Pentacotripeptide-repeat region of PRORP domain-containing protein n=1 Tax=Hydnomerulius pinastri MD-312 TaxID=994086 RepID=A0A0C9VSZ5_9AGAM|nr:hypothetical protein HYDPIDRAFT_97377 [Hydnomerulius pinastri MD-312]
MLPKVANHLFLHTSRAVALVQNQSGALRNVLQSGPSSTVPWGAGAGSSWGGAGPGAGPGGAKFNAGSKFYNGYTGAGRAITQANSSAAQDGATKGDDEKEDITATFVTPRSSSARRPRTLARRHSLSLPAGRNDHERQMGAGVLQTVQMHLRERHAFAPATAKEQQDEVEMAPESRSSRARRNSTASHTSMDDMPPFVPPPPADQVAPATEAKSAPVEGLQAESDERGTSFSDAIRNALNQRDTQSIHDHVQWLIDPSKSPSLAYDEPVVSDFNSAIHALNALGPHITPTRQINLYNALLARGLMPNLGVYISMILALTERDQEVQSSLQALEARAKRQQLRGRALDEDVAAEESIAKRKAALLAEDNFAIAMSIFEAACGSTPVAVSTSANKEPTPSGQKLTRRARPLASYFPTVVYTALLRSCSYHSSVDAALRVYNHLETRWKESSSATGAKSPGHSVPHAPVLLHLLSTYVNAGDLAGAKEVFAEYKELASQGYISDAPPNLVSQIKMWNKMMEAYFGAGQPAAALRLLEMMMDESSQSGIPAPASSTFTTIINGFCTPSSLSQGIPNAPKPDIDTALSWFNRLLQQSSVSRNPFEPSRNPARPNQDSWVAMLYALAYSSSEKQEHLQELNRLYNTFVEIAPQEKLKVRPADTLVVLDANLHFLEGLATAQETGLRTKETEQLAIASLEFIAMHLPDGSSQVQGSPAAYHVANHLSRAYPHFVRYGMGQKFWELAQGLVAFEEKVVEKPDARSSPVLKYSGGALADLIPRAFDDLTPVLDQTLPLMRLAGRLNLQPTPSMASNHLHAYISAPLAAQQELTIADNEAIFACALALPGQPSPSDILSPPECAYAGLKQLMEVMSKAQVKMDTISTRMRTALTGALYTTYVERDVSDFLFGLGASFRMLALPLAERKDEEAHIPRAPTPPSASTYPADVPPPPQHVIVDSEVSRHIDQWFPSHPSLTVHDAYAALQAAISAEQPRHPHPASLARLINGLGRARDIAAVRSVYATAQHVIFSPLLTKNPTWQSQAWFMVEDNMIIAFAHAGDMEAAFAHRDRITAAGGIPSPDAYGSLIECVKDTTDDTSNAMALFAECQMLGTKPNVYLYNTMISKLAKARKADFALEMFQQMKALGYLRPSSITYGAVIAACARVGDTLAAEQLFEEMASQPNFKPRIPPYNTMMQLYAHTKPDREMVLKYFNKMTDAGITPSAHTYKLLIDAYGTIEPIDVKAMEDVFQRIQMSRVQLQGSHWAALINAYGCVLKDLDRAISIFDSIATHPSSKRGTPLPDSVTYESLINVLVTHKRMDLAQTYLTQLRESGVHMTAYIANLLIKGYAANGDINEARTIFESLSDPASGVAAPGNHVPHDSTSLSVSPNSRSYREPSTWEAMFRAELGNGDRDRAVALLERLQARQFPPAVYNRIRGIMLDDSVSPWAQSPESLSP